MTRTRMTTRLPDALQVALVLFIMYTLDVAR
jgi:hypothetical protein